MYHSEFTREAEPVGGFLFNRSIYLLKGVVLHSCRSWVSKPDIHRAGSWEKEITSWLGCHKDEFGDEGILQRPRLLVLELNAHAWPQSQ